MTEQEELAQLRRKIDHLDSQLQQLVNQRARYAQQVAEVKLKYAQENQPVVFYRPEREAQVLRCVMANNDGPVPDAAMAALIREVMSVCLALEQPLTIAFSATGAGRRAAAKHFGQSASFAECVSEREAIESVASGTAHYAVISCTSEFWAGVMHKADLQELWSGLSVCGEVTPDVGPSGEAFWVVGSMATEASGWDRTSWLLAEDSSVEGEDLSGQLKIEAEQSGVELAQAQWLTAESNSGLRAFWLEVNGHQSEAAVDSLQRTLESSGFSSLCIGSYPIAAY